MDVLPAFRRRDAPGRGRYMRLENDPDVASQQSNSSRNSSLRQRRRHDNSRVLCDRCWVRHEREPASKRCLDCDENLCVICARCDEIRRPWWLPTLLAQCWRFFFSKAFVPHSFVELYEDDVIDRRHWVHTQEASHIQPIPRVTRNSLRSNKSSTKVKRQQRGYDNAAAQTISDDEDMMHTTDDKDDNLTRSRSFEGFQTRRRVKHRRTRSVDRIHEKRRHKRKETLWNSYHTRAESYENNWDNDNILSSDNILRKKVVKGKDIDIELTGKDVKVTVNTTDNVTNGAEESENYSKPKCAVKKSKKDAKHKAPQAYTEQIFTDVPIWFKRQSSKNKSAASSNDRRHSLSSSGNSSQNRSKTNATRSDDCSNNRTQHQNGVSQSKTSSKSNYLNSSRNSFTEYPDYQNRTQYPQDSPDADRYKQNYAFGDSPEARRTDTTRDFDISTNYIVEEPPDQCPICLEDLPNLEARILRCDHQIHTKCLREFLVSMDVDFGIRCPVCNQMTTVTNYYAPREMWYRELPISTSV